MEGKTSSDPKVDKTDHLFENSKFSALDFANTVTVPSACRSDWIARKGPYSIFEVLMRMHPEVHKIILFAYD